MLNKEDILALAWEHSEGSGKRYTFTEESLFEFLNELKKDQATSQDEREPVAWQHKKPTVNDSGEVVGYSTWTNGKGLDWWPHRPLYAAPKNK